MHIDPIVTIKSQDDLLKSIEFATRNQSIFIVADDIIKEQIKKLSGSSVKVLTAVEAFVIKSMNPSILKSERAMLLLGCFHGKDSPILTLPITLKVDIEKLTDTEISLKDRVISHLSTDLKQALNDGDIFIKDGKISTRKNFRDIAEFFKILGITVENKTFYLNVSVGEIASSFENFTVLTPNTERDTLKSKLSGVQALAGNLEINRLRLTEILMQCKTKRENGTDIKISIIYEKDESLEMLSSLSRDWISIKSYKELLSDDSHVKVFIEPPSTLQTLSYYLMTTKKDDFSLWVQPLDNENSDYGKAFLHGESGEKLVFFIKGIIDKEQKAKESTIKRKGDKTITMYRSLAREEFLKKTDIITSALGNKYSETKHG